MIDHRTNAMMDSIRKTLIAYADEVNNLVSSGRTDILVDAEHIFRDLLNTMYGYNLTNANQTRANYPAVDLIDAEHGVAVQITSTNARQKADRTVDTFLRHDLEKGYPTLIYLILTFAPPFRNADQLIHKSYNQGVDLRIMTLLDIYYKIEKMPFERVTLIAECLDKHIGLAQSVESEAGVDFATPSVVPSELPEICQQVFRLASILPSEGLRRTVFEHGLCLEQKKAVDDLIDCKLLKEKGDVLLVYPYYRNSSDFAPSSTECQSLLEQLWHYESSWQWDTVLWRDKTAVCRSLAQIFATAATMFPEFSAVYAHRSAELWRYTHQYKEALRQEQSVLIHLESAVKNAWDVARAHHFTGECHDALQKYDLARKDWEFVLTFCQNSPHVSVPDLARAFLNLGKALLKLNEYHAAEIHLLSALNLIEKLRKDADHLSLQLWHKDTYDTLATLYTMLDLGQKASTCTQNTQGSPDKQDLLWEDLYSKRHILLEDLFLASALSNNAFVGREAELAEIEKRFETERIVVLSGLGGTGKTELAIRYGSEYEAAGKGMAYFVRFQRSFFQTVVQEISRGIPDYRCEGKSEDQIYKDTMAALERCWKNDLLILDNADLTDFPVLRRELSALPLRILITTRQDLPKAIHVKGLDRSSLYAIFKQHGVDLPRTDMDDLIEAVDGHTLTVDLIARTLQQQRGKRIKNDLLGALKDYKLTDGFAQVNTAYGRSSERAQINKHLTTVFKVTTSSEPELELLRCATLLPQEGIDEELFLSAFTAPHKIANTLDSLIEKGWLIAEGGLLRIHPVIRIVCIEELKPSDENCNAFLEGVRAQYDPYRYNNDQYTQMADLFTEASTILEDRSGYWANVAGHLWNELSEPQRALACSLRSIEKAEKSQPDTTNLAASYNNAGYAYGILGDHQKALDYKLKALAIREKILPGTHPDLALSYDNIGNTYGDLGNHRKALEYQLKALCIHKRVLPPDHPDLAASYNNVGYTFGALGEHTKALEYKMKALEIREMVIPVDHPDLALSYSNAGSTYSALGDHEKALEYQLKALSIFERVLPPDHPILASSYNNVGNTYHALGDYERALEYQLKALGIRERVLPPDHPDLAHSYNSIGNIYSDLGDYQKALEYFFKATAILERVLPANHPEIAKAYSNVGHAYGYLGAYSTALAYLERALAIAVKSLPQEHPELISLQKDVQRYQQMRNMLAHGVTSGIPDDSNLSK